MTIHSNGKLLLSGEYFVLDGALALAVPTQLGQNLRVETSAHDTPAVYWKSYDHEHDRWFEGIFGHQNFEIKACTIPQVADTLSGILRAVFAQNPTFMNPELAYHCSTYLEFPRYWGLGSSSTLIHGISTFGRVDPFRVLAESMGGSGYDIACAACDEPILYRRDGQTQVYESVDFRPDFCSQLYFVYLGKKQNSRDGIRHYKEKISLNPSFIDEVSALTIAMTKSTQLIDFEIIINEHETLLSSLLQLPKVKNLYFWDYWGSVKSLGAWGGDFVLLSSNRSATETMAYCKSKGFDTVLSYEEMVLNAESF